MMDQGRITAQGSYDDLLKVKEFREIMNVNDLNKNLEVEDKKSSKGSAEGDTESAGDHSDDDE